MKIKRIVTGMLEENGYIIYDKEGGESWVVDPGENPRKFIKKIQELDLTVKGILLTHHHSDHTGAVGGLRDQFDCPVYIHWGDEAMYKKPVDKLLSHGDTLALGEEVLTVLHTPGHTEGSVCFYAEKSRVSFTGDTIFNVDLGRTDLKDGDPYMMETSIRDIISKWENDFTIYPGHGDPANMKFVRSKNQEFLDLLP
ncbi:MAG: MBL fold metallo-hydrolase [Firmicutes bacterium]|nr:MBL fold metallo-hydrolase [Bacillota bacterium]